ncbi:MAG: hypothetical protein JNM51_15445, partial [Bacteroidia bacterium]|nr:hypothetical protein [Bacteroidia bacterium]
MSQILNIYRIDKNNRQLVGLLECEKIIEKILKSSFKKKNQRNEFDLQNLKQVNKDGITYYLYLYNTDEIVSDWKEFLPDELVEEDR